jgi:sulfite reductase (NADPH) hemoprotein beta-component
MYKYDAIDRQLVNERVAQFRDQVRRWKSGELTDDEFRPLRLQNGLYIQRHAPMLRIAVPYGMLNSTQLRKLADIARTYDRGYGHFTTRHNMQFNWPKIEDVPDILAHLAEVEMHAIQTSGNCIRNVTTDPFAGVAADEVIDPRPLAEIIRQWSTFHPEFAFLPRKFKIAISGTPEDRAVTWFHDIGLQLYRRSRMARPASASSSAAASGARRSAARSSANSCPGGTCSTYLRSHPARLQPLRPSRQRLQGAHQDSRQALGVEEFARLVEADWAHLKDGPGTLTQTELDRVAAHFRDAGLRAAGGGRTARRKSLRALGRPQHPPAQGPRLRRRHAVAEAARRRPGRHHLRADGSRRRPRRPLQLRRTARQPRAEHHPRRRPAGRPVRSLAGRRRPPASPPPTSAC